MSLINQKFLITVVVILGLIALAGRLDSKVGKPKGKGDQPLRLRAQAAVAVDVENRVILYSKNPTDQRSIASITKLMTILVFLDLSPDLDLPIIIQPEDRIQGTSNFPVGNSYRLIDLLHGVLLSSDNRAAMTLVRSTGLSLEGFAQKMNQKAASLGLTDSHFADPTGLDEGNVSSALDCARLIEIALQNELITSITQKKEYHCRSLLKKRLVHLYNTNRLLSNQSLEVLIGKTGFIRKAGYCLATCVGDGNGKKIAFVVLGAPSNTTRFQEMYKLIRWTAKNYKLAIS
jgi:D-alanyl-D-alanine endopeptidase (penicillin-binding protein 7)